MKSASELVNQLHGEYCARSGHDLVLNYQKEARWGEWLSYRKEKPFTVDDLRTVIRYLVSQIAEMERKPASLLFRNLIESPDRFEEDLSLALTAKKPTPQKGFVCNYRPIVPPTPENRADPAEFAEFAKSHGRSAKVQN